MHEVEAADAFIATSAEVHSLVLVSRNTSDFEAILKSILTPWTKHGIEEAK